MVELQRVSSLGVLAGSMLGAHILMKAETKILRVVFSVVIAIPAGLLVSGALGAAFYVLEIRQLKNASNLIKIVATLALFVIAPPVILVVVVSLSLSSPVVVVVGTKGGMSKKKKK